jgi:hypothetical protein
MASAKRSRTRLSGIRSEGSGRGGNRLRGGGYFRSRTMSFSRAFCATGLWGCFSTMT